MLHNILTCKLTSIALDSGMKTLILQSLKVLRLIDLFSAIHAWINVPLKCEAGSMREPAVRNWSDAINFRGN